jgi:hypothetical protein
LVLRLTGLRGRARCNTLTLTADEQALSVSRLPSNLIGLCLTCLSDLYLEGSSGSGGHIAAAAPFQTVGIRDHPLLHARCAWGRSIIY